MQETAVAGVGDEVEVVDTDHVVVLHTDGDAPGLVPEHLGGALLLGPDQDLVLGPAPVTVETLLDTPVVEAGTGVEVEIEAGPEHQLKEVQGLVLVLVPEPGMNEGNDGRFKCYDYASYCFISSCGGIHESNMATHDGLFVATLASVLICANFLFYLPI